jgi:hypothetical protein
MHIIPYVVLISLALHGCGSRATPDETRTAAGADPAAPDAAANPAAPAGGCYRQVVGLATVG